MSSTNRGAERRERDFYPTPAKATKALLDWAHNSVDDINLVMASVLDPCAGDGAILRVAREFGCARLAYEIRPECRESLDIVTHPWRVTIGDALAIKLDLFPVDAVITNPPFSLSREFIDAYRDRAPFAAFLLPLNFLASQKRAAWWIANPPAHVLVLPFRPSFTGDGKTDSVDYGWFVWRQGTPRGNTQLDWLVSP